MAHIIEIFGKKLVEAKPIYDDSCEGCVFASLTSDGYDVCNQISPMICTRADGSHDRIFVEYEDDLYNN